MSRSLILCGTRALGSHFAALSLASGFETTVVGNRAVEMSREPALRGAMFRGADLADPYALPRVMCGCWSEMTHVIWEVPSFGRKPPLELTPEDARLMADMGLFGGIGALTALHRLKTASRPLADRPGSPFSLAVVVPSWSWQTADGMAVQAALVAAAAHFARGYATSLALSLPGSRTALVHLNPKPPGETATDRAAEARHVWELLLSQATPFRESSLKRNGDGVLTVEHGAPEPEPTL